MNYKHMLDIAESNSTRLSEAEKIYLGGKPAVNMRDGFRRWLEDGQTVEFENPQFMGKTNAEFKVAGQSGQTIWFSQLSRRAMKDDLQTPIYSEIKMKGEEACKISDKFKTAATFWSAIKSKRFRVEVIGESFYLNEDNPKVKMLMQPAVTGVVMPKEKREDGVYNYLMKNYKERDSTFNGMLKKGKAYRLIETF